MFWIALELSIPKMRLNIMLSLTDKQLEAFKFDRVAESDNNGWGWTKDGLGIFSLRKKRGRSKFTSAGRIYHLWKYPHYTYLQSSIYSLCIDSIFWMRRDPILCSQNQWNFTDSFFTTVPRELSEIHNENEWNVPRFEQNKNSLLEKIHWFSANLRWFWAN